MIASILKHALAIGLETVDELTTYLLAIKHCGDDRVPVNSLLLIKCGATPFALDSLIGKDLLIKTTDESYQGSVLYCGAEDYLNEDSATELANAILICSRLTKERKLITWLALVDSRVFLDGYIDVDASSIQSAYASSSFVKSEEDLSESRGGKLVKDVLRSLSYSNNVTKYGNSFLKLVMWASNSGLRSITPAILASIINQHPLGLTRKELEVELAKVTYPVKSLPTVVTRLGTDLKAVTETPNKRNRGVVYKATGCPVNPYPLRYHFEVLSASGINNIRELMMIYTTGNNKISSFQQVTDYFKDCFGISVDAAFVKRVVEKKYFIYSPDDEVIIKLTPEGEKVFMLFK